MYWIHGWVGGWVADLPSIRQASAFSGAHWTAALNARAALRSSPASKRAILCGVGRWVGGLGEKSVFLSLGDPYCTSNGWAENKKEEDTKS